MTKTDEKLAGLLDKIRRIDRMERGKICQMSGREHYNHQHWQNGRNVVRYVPANQVPSLQEAIDGYRLFMDLVGQYADEVIARTRGELKARPTRRKPAKARARPKAT